MRITQLTITPVGSGATTTFNITATVNDAHGNPYVGTGIRLVASLIQGATVTQDPVDTTAITGATGTLAFTWTPPVGWSMSMGDVVEIAAHMARDGNLFNPPLTLQSTLIDSNPIPATLSFPDSFETATDNKYTVATTVP